MSGLRTVTIWAVALVSSAATYSVARADSPLEAAAEAGGAQRMTLPKDQIYVQAYLDFNLSSSAVAKPISLAPDVWYGLRDDVSVGLIHSSMGGPTIFGGSGFFGGVGNGVCFTGKDNNCASIYQNVGLDARYHLFDGTDKPVVLAADGGLFFRDLDPLQMAIKLGVVGKKTVSKIDLVFGASIIIGLTNRDGDIVNGALTNKEVISVPVSAIYPLSDKLGVGGQTGLILPFDQAGDTFLIPLAVAGRYIISPKLAVEGALSFPTLLGGSAASNDIEIRVLTVGASYLL